MMCSLLGILLCLGHSSRTRIEMVFLRWTRMVDCVCCQCLCPTTQRKGFTFNEFWFRVFGLFFLFLFFFVIVAAFFFTFFLFFFLAFAIVSKELDHYDKGNWEAYRPRAPLFRLLRRGLPLRLGPPRRDSERTTTRTCCAKCCVCDGTMTQVS